MALDGPTERSAQQLAHIASELRFSTILVGVPAEDPVGFVSRLDEDVAPRLRDLVATD